MNNFKIRILKTASTDIQNAINYYHEKSPKIAEKFKTEVCQKIEHLKFNPFFQIRRKNQRFLSLKNFPFIIIYSVDEDNLIVSIYGVFHTSQNPSKYP